MTNFACAHKQADALPCTQECLCTPQWQTTDQEACLLQWHLYHPRQCRNVCSSAEEQPGSWEVISKT